jgi:hypothetical protein
VGQSKHSVPSAVPGKGRRWRWNGSPCYLSLTLSKLFFFFLAIFNYFLSTCFRIHNDILTYFTLFYFILLSSPFTAQCHCQHPRFETRVSGERVMENVCVCMCTCMCLLERVCARLKYYLSFPLLVTYSFSSIHPTILSSLIYYSCEIVLFYSLLSTVSHVINYYMYIMLFNTITCNII